MTCHDESCDLVHCAKCRCHTAGNELGPAGMCQDCWVLEEEEENQRQQMAMSGKLGQWVARNDTTTGSGLDPFT